jgi:hypothetical protein
MTNGTVIFFFNGVGMGRYYYPNGNYYEGLWVENMLDETGKFINNKGVHSGFSQSIMHRGDTFYRNKESSPGGYQSLGKSPPRIKTPERSPVKSNKKPKPDPTTNPQEDNTSDFPAIQFESPNPNTQSKSPPRDDQEQLSGSDFLDSETKELPDFTPTTAINQNQDNLQSPRQTPNPKSNSAHKIDQNTAKKTNDRQKLIVRFFLGFYKFFRMEFWLRICRPSRNLKN